eukprot:2080060-Rhodomonas_salina.1
MAIEQFAAPETLRGAGQDQAQFLTDRIRFETVHFEPEKFHVLPSIDREGTLFFLPAFGFSGNVTIEYRIVTDSGLVSDWARTIITVLPVNQPPMFEIKPVVTELEDSALYSEHHVAFNIARGVIPEATELGIYYTDLRYRQNEENQTVTFSASFESGNAVLLKSGPNITSNGSLSFDLNLHENGNATFLVYLTDDGDNVAPSNNRSLPVSITFQVLPVNDAPSFSIPSSYSFVESSGFDMFEVPGFATRGIWSFGFQGPANEVHQPVTFVLAYIDGNMSLFNSTPAVTQSGSLVVTVQPYQWGEARYSIYLEDAEEMRADQSPIDLSGSPTLNFTIYLTPINTVPTIGIPPVIWLWTNPYATLAEEYDMLVQDFCCTPCPGPAPACATEPCCSRSDDLGTLQIVRPYANYSAGPYEEWTQTLTFTATEISSSGLFEAGKSMEVGEFGRIHFNLAVGAAGHADLLIEVQDSGGIIDARDVDYRNQTLTLRVLVGYTELRVWFPTSETLDASVLRLEVATAFGTGLDFVLMEPPGSVSFSRRLLQTGSFQRVRFLVVTETIPDVLGQTNLTASLFPGLEKELDWFSRSAAGNGETDPRFELASFVEVPENTDVAPAGLVTGIELDAGRFGADGNQVVSFDAEVVRFKTPAFNLDWQVGNGTVAMFSSTPYLLLECTPFCSRGTIVLNTTDIHGVAELRLTLRSSLFSRNTTKTIVVAVTPVPDAPYVLPKYQQNLTILEDGGPCTVIVDCESKPVVFDTASVFGDLDQWFQGADFLAATSSDPLRLNSTIVNLRTSNFTLTPALHQHGVFTVEATDASGLSTSPPLTVIVQHVNHAPHLIMPFPYIVVMEDSDDVQLVLTDHIADVDTIDQQDPLAEVDSLVFNATSLAASKVDTFVENKYFMNSTINVSFLLNQHGNASVRVNATDRVGFVESWSLFAKIISVPDAPHVQEPYNDTLTLVEDEGPYRINVSRLFGDVDNCFTLNLQEHCSYDGDFLTLTTQSNLPDTIVAEVQNNSELVLHMVQHEHTDARYEVLVDLIATDMYNLTHNITYNISVLPVNDNPVAVLQTIYMVENQTRRRVRVGELGQPTQELQVLDVDMLTNQNGDSLKLFAESSDTSMLLASVTTETEGGNAVNGTPCSFPFNYSGQEFDRCTTLDNGIVSWCMTAVDGVWGNCVHYVELDLIPSEFGNATVNLTAIDSFGGVGWGSFLVAVSMVNMPPLFNITQEVWIYEQNVLHPDGDNSFFLFENFAFIYTFGDAWKYVIRTCENGQPFKSCQEDVCSRPPARQS